MKKFLPILFLLIILLIQNPVLINAQTTSLWVNSLGSEHLTWLTSGTTPYIDDTVNYIYKATADGIEGHFSFPDLTGTPTISAAVLYMECYRSGSPATFTPSIYNGVSWTSLGIVTPDAAYSYKTINVFAYLDTYTKVNAALVEFLKSSSTKTIYIRRCYLYITYSTIKHIEETVTGTIIMGKVSNRLIAIKRTSIGGIVIGDISSITKGLSQTVTRNIVIGKSSSMNKGLTQTVTGIIIIGESSGFNKGLNQIVNGVITIGKSTNMNIEIFRNPVYVITIGKLLSMNKGILKTIDATITFVSSSVGQFGKSFTLSYNLVIGSFTIKNIGRTFTLTKDILFSGIITRNINISEISLRNIKFIGYGRKTTTVVGYVDESDINVFFPVIIIPLILMMLYFYLKNKY